MSRARARRKLSTRAKEHGDHSAAQVVIPRQLIPQAIRQAEHPFPHGHVGEHMIEEVGGALGHPAAAAAWTQRLRFTGKRNQPIEAAVATAKPRKPASEPAKLKKITKFLLDEAGQAFPVSETGGLSTKVSK
jgi:hypothetical protein